MRTMTTLTRYAEDIPENIYVELSYLIYNQLKSQFTKMVLYENKIKTNQISLPKAGESIQKKSRGMTFYVTKVESDLLDLTYNVFFRIRLDNFVNIINDFMKSKDLNFDFRLFCDKNKLLQRINSDLKTILNQKISVTLDPMYVTFTMIVDIETQHDYIEMLQ